jgi:phosphodiesterase/alkaline phosphatase D-like protein
VRLDGELRWPLRDSGLPASRIRTLHDDAGPRILFGSCRTAAPHEAPWALELALDTKGRGVDALYAYALRMLQQAPDEWPDLAVFLGDQVYADDSSPNARARIAEKRKQEAPTTAPPDLVRDFEEYCWLYEESWSPKFERWFFSVVPSVMVFDDHDMIDDWNISDAWVREIRREDWWEKHIVEGLMTYWLYNISAT